MNAWARTVDVRSDTPSRTITDSLQAICQALGARLELNDVLHTILSLTLREMNAQQGSVLLYDPLHDQLRMLAAIGLPEEIVAKGYIPRRGSIAEWVVQHNEPLILNDRAQGSDFSALDDRRRIVSALCVPLRVGGRVLGTINLNRTDPACGPFEPADVETMLILAAQAAVAIENARLHETILKSERLAAIGQTVAGISHCIKNILTGVRGGLSLVEMAGQRQDWTLHGQGLDILKRNLDRLSGIVLDMLDYSKERTPCKGPVSIPSLFDEVAATVAPAARQKRIDVASRCAPEARTAHADGQQLFRCLLNLAHNAIDATPEGGSVRLTAERDGSPRARNRLKPPGAPAAIVLRVADTGPGIPEDQLPLLFEPFFSTKGSKGTGLGLAVTRKIVEEHGGSIHVESRPGEPAVFALYLPDEGMVGPDASDGPDDPCGARGQDGTGSSTTTA